ncbi:hypothetical protein EDD86DRAFT_214629 [Gorgonomyces haynaldii]|nr:hypothetical protein EDD86DRAFT_214629 [Gorgonomyces haynaldii]
MHFESELAGSETTETQLVIVDFDSTLFSSPLPNPSIWMPNFVGQIISDLSWFQQKETLAYPYIPQQPQWFDTDVIQSIPKGFRVLLTGRRRDLFHDRILELLSQQPIEFDLVILREGWDPTQDDYFESTLDFKICVLNKLVQKHGFKRIVMYDDRKKHLEIFANHLSQLVEQRTIDDYETHHIVHQSHTFMDPELEIKLVKELVEKTNNRILEYRQRVGLMRSMGSLDRLSKPDLSLIVSPQEESFPRRKHSISSFRHLIELDQIPYYTAIFLCPESQQKILDRFQCPAGWQTKADHVTLNLGPSKHELLQDKKLGDVVEFEAIGFGSLECVQALQVKLVDIKSENTVPHITMFLSPTGRAKQSNDILNWQPIEPLALGGIIRTHFLLGNKRQKTVQAKKPVSLGQLVKKHHPHLTGPDIGRAVQKVEQWMCKGFLENSLQNQPNIEFYVQTMSLD